ncbi:MAG: hypothetical protein J5915_01850, partial [Acidaminococcaceae bacterium]|nr:hypothetical protein [Acidaminococcaceae bacterium]
MGGASYSRDQTNNKVYVNSGTVNGDVYGGRLNNTRDTTATGNVSTNRAEVSGGTVTGNVYGGSVEGNAQGSAVNNTVRINSGTVTGHVDGGYSANGAAENNKVYMDGGTVEGYVEGGLSDSGSAGAKGNEVTISGGTVKNVVLGAYVRTNSTGNAENNKVTVSNTASLSDDVQGGQVKGSGKAISNSVTLTGGTASKGILGGATFGNVGNAGSVENNVVTMSGGNAGWVYGGYSDGYSNNGGEVTGNTTTITGGSVGSYAFGGASYSDSAATGDVNGNQITISSETGATTIGGRVFGGESFSGTGISGNANSNVMTISGGTINGNVGGGASVTTSGTAGNANSNEVTVNGGTVNGSVFGGYGYSGATGNIVTVSGGTLSNGDSVGDLMGGYTKTGAASGNTVTITGGTVTRDIYGGYTQNGTSNDNTVNLAGTANLSGSAVYGCYRDDGAGNELHVGGVKGGTASADTIFASGTDNKVERVANFNTIALRSVNWSTSVAALEATLMFNNGPLDITNLKFYEGGSEKTVFAKGEKMTLLASGTDNNINALSLKYNGGTADLSETKLSQVVKEGTITPDSGENGVTVNASKDAHIVSLDAANSYKNVTYKVADYVQGVSFGEVTWGTGRAVTGMDFSSVTDDGIDTGGLTFKNPGTIAADGAMQLLTGATGLAAGTDAEHSQDFTKNATNGVAVTGTLNGTVVRTTSDEIGYQVTGKTLSVDLSGWDGNEDSTTISGWAKATSTTVETDGMTVTGMNPGDSRTILTSDTTDFFKDAVINGTNKWKESGGFSETTKGVTVAGTTTGGGVKVDETTNKSIIYQQSKNNVTSLNLEGMTFVADDVAAAFGNAYDFSGATISASDALFTNASSLISNQSMTLVDATGALGTETIAAFTDKSYTTSFNDNVTENLNIKGAQTDWLRQDGGTKLIYTVGDKIVTDATLSGDLAWSDGAVHYTNENYKFDENSKVNVGANFTATADPLAGDTKTMTLIKNAAGVDASKVTGTPTFTVSLDQTNTTLSANATGTAGLSGNDVTYTVSGVELQTVAVKSVGDTYDTVPAGWTMAGDLTIDTDGMTVPTFASGYPKAILKGNGYFDNATITGSNAFGTKDFEPVSGNGVTISGTQDKGVDKSPDNAYIVYKMGKKNVQTVDIGEVAWGGAALDGSSDDYDYRAVATYGTDSFDVTYTDADVRTVATDDSMTLLQANATLAAAANKVKTSSYDNVEVAPGLGVFMNGSIAGRMSRSGNNVVFTATENRATQLTFRDVEWKDTGALMTRPANITFAGANVDTSAINFTNINELEANSEMTLVSNFGNTVGTITGTKYRVGLLEGEGAASLSDNNDLIFTATTAAKDMTPAEATHETVMAMDAGTAVLSSGREYVDNAIEGLGLVTNVAPDGTATFASMGGGANRYKTGSHVDTHTWSAVVAVGSKREHKKGSLEWGVFAEYGRGTYKLHDDNGGRGDGDTHYAGGGLLAKWTNKHDVYTEASFRMGRMSDNASNMLTDRFGNSYGYDIHANYTGAHVGIGKIIKVKKNRDLDVYGKFFYLHRNGVDFDAGGNHYRLDSVNSNLLRIGARYGSNDKKWNWYGGLAYEYEFDGKSRGTVDGLPIRSASISGGSVRGEIGMRMDATKTNPWKVDIGIYGYGGKHRGIGGNVNVAYMF